MELTKNISQTKIIKSLLAVIFGSILLAVSSKIQTPFTLVPATMQTFVVLFLGMILGYKLAVYSVILYLLQGSIGLPVFAKGGGIAYLMGPTGGYLIVKENGDVLCYHIYNRNEFENYLFNNTKLDTASSSRHDFGTIYEQNEELYFKLNLQIRFMK